MLTIPPVKTETKPAFESARPRPRPNRQTPPEKQSRTDTKFPWAFSLEADTATRDPKTFRARLDFWLGKSSEKPPSSGDRRLIPSWLDFAANADIMSDMKTFTVRELDREPATVLDAADKDG